MTRQSWPSGSLAEWARRTSLGAGGATGASRIRPRHAPSSRRRPPPTLPARRASADGDSRHPSGWARPTTAIPSSGASGRRPDCDEASLSPVTLPARLCLHPRVETPQRPTGCRLLRVALISGRRGKQPSSLRSMFLGQETISTRCRHRLLGGYVALTFVNAKQAVGKVVLVRCVGCHAKIRELTEVDPNRLTQPLIFEPETTLISAT